MAKISTVIKEEKNPSKAQIPTGEIGAPSGGWNLGSILQDALKGSQDSLTNVKNELAADTKYWDDLKSSASAFYDNQYNEYANKLKADAEAAKNQTSQQYGELLRQAYVSNMQNQQKLSDRLAEAGIRGGGSETANLKLMTGYQNTRNKTNSERQSALANIDKQMNDNLFNFKITNDQAKNAYMQQIESEMRQIAENKRQEAVEQGKIDQQYKHEELMFDKQQKASQALADAQKKEAQQVAYWESVYSKYSLESLQNSLKKATNVAQKTAINNAIVAKKAEEKAKKAEQDTKNTQYWTNKYSTYWNISNLEKARKNAKTKLEISIINQRIGYIREYNKNKEK